jgi:hypothetical protein
MPTGQQALRTLAVLALVSLARSASADGIPVMDAFSGGQNRPGLAADGAGGAWVAFKTDAGTNGLVHVSGAGIRDAAWPNGIYSTGLAVQQAGTTRVLSNGPDRVLLVSDFCAYTTLAMGYDGTGDTLPGFPASVALFYPQPRAVLGSDGRILAAVTGALGSGGYGVRLAILDAAGHIVDEREVQMGFQIQPDGTQAIPDGAGGMILGVSMYYSETYSTALDVGLIRIAADGTRPWGDVGIPVCWANTNQTELRVWPDGAGGVLMTWTDARTSPAASPLDIYAARFTSAGLLATGWTAQGKRVASVTGGQFESRVVDDGAGGAWILWRDQRVSDIDLYFTHVLGNGQFAAGFSSAGTLLCGATGSASEPQLAPDGFGGFFAAWSDPRDGEADVYGTHVTGAGVPAAGWPADGLALCTDPAAQSQLGLVATGPGRALLAWRDGRAAGGRVYVLGLEDSGPITTDVGGIPGRGLRLRATTNPVAGSPELWLSAPAGEPVEVLLVDISGRIVRRARFGASGTESRARFEGGPLAAGIYFATARRGAERATLRVCVLN